MTQYTMLMMTTVWLVLGISNDGMAQETSAASSLIEGEIDHGFFASPVVKFSKVDGEFANLVGLYGGWLINHRFLVGFGVNGMTNRVDDVNLGYGGLVLEYFHRPDQLWNFSFKGLIGGGNAVLSGHQPFFVAEPEVKITLNVSERFRLDFGGGYRFIGGARGRGSRLSGATATFGLRWGVF